MVDLENKHTTEPLFPVYSKYEGRWKNISSITIDIKREVVIYKAKDGTVLCEKPMAKDQLDLHFLFRRFLSKSINGL